jgi:prepilin-type N-terminal cleavage/methylation domain-containing protein
MGLNYKNGFSLIEILIVIAIVGILSSVVLFALTPSKNKAKDARIISDLHEIMSSAPSVYDPISGQYDLGKLVALTSSTMIDAINNDPNGVLVTWSISSNNHPNTWTLMLLINTVNYNQRVIILSSSFAIYAKLSTGNSYYCIDSQGGVKSVQNINSAVCQ